WVGPENKFYVPIAEMPKHVPKAVLSSEDAGFFAHRGFDLEEMRNSVMRALKSGERARGASTISQQLTKNLFLGRERTAARKVREALITMALEASIPKNRLLEVYLNIIEWGPGIYGIGEAAHHYFCVDARQLTAKQAAFLASIIPNPVKYHVMYETGTLLPAWPQKIREVLYHMYANEFLTARQYAAARGEPLIFQRSCAEK